MLIKLKKIVNKYLESLSSWSNERIFNLFLFNIFIMLMIVLRSAGYFDPFFLITINTIVLLGLIIAVFLLGVGSKLMFSVALVFWIFAALLKMVKIDVWAERTSVYFFQAFIIGVFLLGIENISLPRMNINKIARGFRIFLRLHLFLYHYFIKLQVLLKKAVRI